MAKVCLALIDDEELDTPSVFDILVAFSPKVKYH
jgi:hypothetical protein